MYGRWADMLHECRSLFGDAPRSFKLMDRLRYMKVGKPGWLKSAKQDGLHRIIDQQTDIFQNGHVIWAHVVQANSLLFQKGSDDCPAALLYTPDPEMQMDPQLLESVSQKIFELKENKPREKDKLAISDLLSDEFSRPIGIEIPRSICSIGSLLMSCTLISRKHLPMQHIRAGVIPVVRDQDNPGLILPLPGKFWSKQFLEWWNED